MQKLVYLWGCLVGVAFAAQGQQAALACGNGRYIDTVFPAPPATTTDVVFGYNTSYNYASQQATPVALQLDVYEPAGDVAAQRPLIILAFGGAFIQGSRKDADIVAICQEFARKGYVTAAIDYRLIENDAANYAAVFNDQSLLADEVIRAAADMKASVRFFKHDAATTNSYRIDPTKIFLGGFSAGAITALQVAYTDSVSENSTTQAAYLANGGLEGNTDLVGANSLLPSYTASGIAGVFNVAGAVNSLNIISAGNPPLYSAQGDADQVVPYMHGVLSPTTYTLYGGFELAARATAVGLTNQLHTVAGGNHGSPANEPDRSQIIAEAATFLQALICPAAPLPVTLSAFAGRVAPEDCTATLTWQTASEQRSYAYEVQNSVDGQAFTALGTVPSRNKPTGAAYTYRVGALAGTRYFRLKMLDTDGSATYSPVVTLAASCASGPLLVAPNPTRDRLTVSGLPAGRCQVVLYNATGQRVAQASADSRASLSLSGLPAGIYLLQVLNSQGTAAGSTRVVKE